MERDWRVFTLLEKKTLVHEEDALLAIASRELSSSFEGGGNSNEQ